VGWVGAHHLPLPRPTFEVDFEIEACAAACTSCLEEAPTDLHDGRQLIIIAKEIDVF
jgi:hypothetical protein